MKERRIGKRRGKSKKKIGGRKVYHDRQKEKVKRI